MKLLNIFILNFLLLGGLTLTTCNQAKAGELPQNQKVKAISTEIREKITFPDELVGKEIAEKVTVEFKINTDKTIEVIGVEATNEFLKGYVKKEIEKLSLTNTEGFEGKVLQISLLFEN
jgi:hypothetical protein